MSEGLRLEFCGEEYDLAPDAAFRIGREGDLVIDDNPYLHRTFLVIHREAGLWWLSNVGNLLSATITASDGQVQAWLSPGARLPIVFPRIEVMFTAGATTYDFTVEGPSELSSASARFTGETGATTIDPVPLTTSQRQLILALAENMLLERVPGRAEVPTSVVAAARLGWSMSKFNRKLDNVCEKLERVGVAGLRGDRVSGSLALSRRARLVEYAVSTRLVTREQLGLLEISDLRPGD